MIEVTKIVQFDWSNRCKYHWKLHSPTWSFLNAESMATETLHLAGWLWNYCYSWLRLPATTHVGLVVLISLYIRYPAHNLRITVVTVNIAWCRLLQPVIVAHHLNNPLHKKVPSEVQTWSPPPSVSYYLLSETSISLGNSAINHQPNAFLVSHLQRLFLTTIWWRRNHFGACRLFLSIVLHSISV